MKRAVRKEPRRVLMTADAVGGVWTYALTLARELSHRGVQVMLATMGDLATADQRQDARAIPGLTLLETDYKLEWMNDPWRDVTVASSWLLNLEANFEPDIVHLNGYVHASLPWQSPVMVVAHSCVLSWWKAVNGVDAPRDDWSRYFHEVSRGLRAADLIVAPSRAMLHVLAECYGHRLVGTKATRVIYNGCDQAVFAPADKEPFAFAAGRLWDEAKNVGAVDHIADELEWPVYIAGETGPSGSSTANSSAKYLGRLAHTDMVSWLGRSSIYVHPARYEPFGLSVLEAALSGCALVLGEISSLREIWQDAALYVPPNDRQRLRSTLQNLIHEPQLRETLARSARQRAAKFTAEKMANSYMQAYQELLDRKGAIRRDNYQLSL